MGQCIPDPDILTMAELGQVLGISVNAAAGLVDRNEIRGWKVPGEGGHRRIRRVDLEAWLERQPLSLRAYAAARLPLVKPQPEPKPAEGRRRRPKVLADPGLLSTSQLAAVLAISTRTAAKMIDREEIPGWRVGDDRRVSRTSLEAWLRTQPPALRALADERLALHKPARRQAAIT